MASKSNETEAGYNDARRNSENNHNNNNYYDDCSASAVEKEDAGRNYQPRKAPLVGWRNGSPTICSSSDSRSIQDIGLRRPNVSQLNPDLTVDMIESGNKLIQLTQRNRPTPNSIQQVPILCEQYLQPETMTNQRVENFIDEFDDLSSSTSKEKRRKKPKIPDGGWGWMVVLASLVISMVADGVSFSFGLLYIEFLHEFGASKSKTAWIGSLFMAVPLLCGPIMSALVDRYGCRKMTILGGLISGLGFILSIFSNSVELMYLTFGVIAGLGLGLCYVTAVVSIAFWFDKKRTLAVGLGACGTGIGTFVYAPMTTYFIQEYGWRGTCLLLAGTFFNMIVAGAIMRDPEWWVLEQRKEQATVQKSNVRPDNEQSDGNPPEEIPDIEELRKLLRSERAPEYFLQNLNMTTETVSGTNKQTAFRSVVNLPTFVKRSEKVRSIWAILLYKKYINKYIYIYINIYKYKYEYVYILIIHIIIYIYIYIWFSCCKHKLSYVSKFKLWDFRCLWKCWNHYCAIPGFIPSS